MPVAKHLSRRWVVGLDEFQLYRAEERSKRRCGFALNSDHPPLQEFA